MIGDFIWFQGGRRYGERTLQTVCTLSMSREKCVQRTERFFGRWGVSVLIVARFIPGLSLVAVPLCGAMAVRLPAFFSYDCAGVTLWAAVGLIIGIAFASEVDVIFALISHLGWQALLVIGFVLALYILYRFCRRTTLENALESALESERIGADAR